MSSFAKLFFLFVLLVGLGAWSGEALAAAKVASAGANWATATWTPAGVPTSGDTCTINSGVNLSVTTAAVCGSLALGSVVGSNTTLTLGAGGSLNITSSGGQSGNLVLNPGNVGSTFTIAAATQTLTVDGTFTTSTTTGTHVISVSTGQVNFTRAAGIAWPTRGTLTVTGNNAGGSVNFTGLVTQTAGTIQNTTTGGTLNFNGGFNHSGGTFTTRSGETINFGGNYTNSGGTQTFNTTSTENFTGTATITPTSTINFGNLGVSPGAGNSVTLAGNVNVAGNLTVSTGTFNLATFTANRSAAGGTITVANGATLNIGGTNSFPANYNTHALGASSTVAYSGTNQTVRDETTTGLGYGNLVLSGSGTKTMPAVVQTVRGDFTMSGTATAVLNNDLTVGGNFNIGAGTSFDDGGALLNVAGNFTQDGTLTSTGVVTLNGGVQTISGSGANGNPPNMFTDLTVSNTAITLARNVTVANAISGTVTLTNTCPIDYTLTSNGGATIAHSCPTVVVNSINCSVSCTATSFSTVSWTVIFSASVTGVDASAFTLVPSGLTGTSITGVTGSGTTWTVSAYSGAGTGTLRLNQTGPGSVSPTLSGTFTTGQPYIIGPPPLLAEYRMDEAFWNGTVNEVADVSGNANNAQAFNGASTIGTTPAISGNPGTCNYGVFDNGGTITQGYVQTPLPNLTTDFTVTAWIRTTNNATAGQRILIDDQNNTGGYGISLGDGTAGILRFFSRGITPVILDSTYTIANNTWYFIAAVADITNKKRTIYVFNTAGALLNTTTEAAWTAGAWGTDAGPVSIGGEVNGPPQTELPASFHFRGNLDEVRVYQQALSQAAVTAIATQTHACAITSSVNHFTIDIGGATASTCVPKNITITALNSLNNVVTNYSGTVNITTSPAHGDWAKATAAGTLTPGAADSGTASYQFAVADGGVAVLALSNDHADPALTVSVVDSLVPTSSTTSAPIAFGDDAFVLTNDTVQVAGRPQAMSAAMWRKAPGAGVCSISNRYTGARNLKAWYTRDIDDPGGTAPSITGMVSPPLGTAVPGSNNLTLSFAAGTANFNLSTVDVGKYLINLRDDSGTFGGGIIDGSSNTITTRPFALVASAVKQGATNNPANTGPAGAVFARAGTNFQATVGAYRWNSAADSNVALGDGIPDAGATLAQITANGAAPSYTWPTTVAGGAPYTPAGGTASPWSNIQTGACPASAPNCFASGIATPTNLSYNEVGSFTLSVAATGFLNTPGVDLTAANGTALVFDNTPARNAVVGRFIPDHFDTVVTAQGSPVGFAYSGNPVGPVPGQPFTVTVTAKNALATPTVTTNYAAGTGFSKDVNLSVPVGGAAGQLYVDAVAGGTGAVPAGNFVLGVGKSDPSVPTDKKISFVFSSLPYYLAAPIQIHAEDADTVTSSGANGAINIRHGRLRVFNAFGSEKASLSLPLRAEYWSGNSWLINADDNFSVIPNSSIALSVVSPATLGTSATGTTLVGGQGSIVLAIPTSGGTGNTGSVDLAINLGTGAADQSCLSGHPVTTGATIPWLRSINGNCAATYDRDPAARGSFGIYAPETRKTIHVRELF